MSTELQHDSPTGWLPEVQGDVGEGALVGGQTLQEVYILLWPSLPAEMSRGSALKSPRMRVQTPSAAAQGRPDNNHR